MKFTKKQIDRYSRQIILKKIGVAGQKKLLKSNVLIVGAGGLGSPIAIYLAALGIGRIGIIDKDNVEISNLSRQIIFSTNDIKKSKSTVAINKLRKINPDIQVQSFNKKLTIKNINQIAKNFDLIVLLDVLEHIEDDTQSLATIRTLMSDKALILITVPAYQWLWSEHDTLHHHVRRYSKKTLKEKLNVSGFRVKYISYFNTLLFPFALVERMKQRIFSSSNEEALSMPNKSINYLLEKIFSYEANFINKISFPFGLSLIVIAENSES